MEEDCQTYVKVCVPCQKHVNLEKLPTQDIHSINSPWPFATWGIDLISMIHPHSQEGYKFIIIAIEYTTKWVEVIPMKLVAQEKATTFL